MKRASILAAAAAVLLTGLNEAASGQSLKIGFVNTLEVLYATAEGKAEIASIQTYIDEKQKEYDSRRLALDQLAQQFQNQQRTLNPATRAEMQRRIETDQLQLKRFQEDTQGEINQRRDALFSRMAPKIQAVINEFASANQYTVIFQRNETQVWVDPALDMTEQITRLYNEKAGAASPTPSAAPQP